MPCIRSPNPSDQNLTRVAIRKNSSQRHHAHTYTECTPLSVGLGDTLELILLLDGVRVAASLGSVDQLFSKALGNALDVAERGLAGTDGEEGDTLVDTAEGRDIDGLATDGTGGTDTGGVFAGTAVDNGIDGDLDGVLVGHDVDLQLLAMSNKSFHASFFFAVKNCGSWQTYDLEGVGDDAHSHELLSVVAAVHHERVGETLNDGALGLPESLDGISAGRV